MVILLVIDNYYDQSNGATITTKRFKEALVKRGHEVRVLTIAAKDDSLIYALKEKKLPLVSDIVSKQDMKFAAIDKNKIRQALEDVDVCHLVFPFKLSRVTNKIANDMKISVTTSYHIMPENIVYGAGVRVLSPLFNWLAYRYFDSFYKKVHTIHVLSKMSESFVEKRYPKAKRFVITNGVTEDFYQINNQPLHDKVRIVSIGRYSKEKSQDITIKAIGLSKYKDQIELILPGKGKQEAKLKKLATKYEVDVKFGFMNKTKLIETLKNAYMFVHSAEIEIEGMSCLEAMASGVVPIISNAKKSASRFFSIEPSNSYRNRDAKDLTAKIDYWIENPNKRAENLEMYQTFIKHFRFEDAVLKFEHMLQMAIDSNDYA